MRRGYGRRFPCDSYRSVAVRGVRVCLSDGFNRHILLRRRMPTAGASLSYQQNPILGARPARNRPLTACLLKRTDTLILPIPRIEPSGYIGGVVLHMIQSAGGCTAAVEKYDIDVQPV